MSDTQFSRGRLSSAVSSMVMILLPGLIRHAREFRAVVLPAAVPPSTIMEDLFSRHIQKYAAISSENVPILIKSIIEYVSPLIFLIENAVPNGVTSRL